MSPHELVQFGEEVIRDAATRNALLRLHGGVAIYARCPSVETHEFLQRPFASVEFIAVAKAWSDLPDLFISRGFQVRENSPQRAVFFNNELTADVRPARFRDWYSFDLEPRLSLAPTTLPLADLLLLKLQRFNFGENDIRDAVALLLDHRITSGEEQETIDRDYIYKLTNRNWALWTTVFDNTVTLEKILDKYLEPEEAQLVWRRIELIQEVMDGKGKSLGWYLRWIPNRRIPWYREARQ